MHIDIASNARTTKIDAITNQVRYVVRGLPYTNEHRRTLLLLRFLLHWGTRGDHHARMHISRVQAATSAAAAAATEPAAAATKASSAAAAAQTSTATTTTKST